MIQEAWGWCTGMTQRDGMGREVGGGFRMGNTCMEPMVDACWCMAKPIQYCKVNNNNIKKKKKKNHVKINDFSNCLGFKPFTQNSSFLCGIVDNNQWLAAWLLGTCVFLSWSPHSQEDVEYRGSDQEQGLHEEESSQFFDLFGLSLGTKT